MTDVMKIIIPMAGYGSRMRPQTWSKPKPLVSLAGGTVLDQLLGLFDSLPEIEQAQFVFILSPNQGDLIQKYMAKKHPQRKVAYIIQHEMRGQSDALWQAREYLKGRMIMIFSDTMIKHSLDFMGNETAEAIAWVKAVPDPRRFGVAEVDAGGKVTRLVEKPKDIDNNLAVVGFYYFREGEKLAKAIEEQLQGEDMLKGEFFLTGAINIMLKKGVNMRVEHVPHWLDAGKPDALLETNRFYLENGCENHYSLQTGDTSTIIPPVFIHPSASISNSTIGPHVSIAAGSVVEDSSIKDSVIGADVHISDSHLEESILGDQVVLCGQVGKFNMGDNSSAVK